MTQSRRVEDARARVVEPAEVPAAPEDALAAALAAAAITDDSLPVTAATAMVELAFAADAVAAADAAVAFMVVTASSLGICVPAAMARADE